MGLDSPPKYTRLQATTFKSDEPLQIDPKGGRFGAGIIRRASLITTGEALGHGMWVDEAFLGQISNKLSEKSSVKVRFTHPGLSSDGLGKVVGRAFSIEDSLDGGQMFADIEFLQSGHNTPDGDLAGYLDGTGRRRRLSSDPDNVWLFRSFLNVILGAEQTFTGENSDEEGSFTSPDADNVHNYPHARLHNLQAADFVDDPAANPDGLFHRSQEIAQDAEKLAAYALGLSGRDAPTTGRPRYGPFTGPSVPGPVLGPLRFGDSPQGQGSRIRKPEKSCRSAYPRGPSSKTIPVNPRPRSPVASRYCPSSGNWAFSFLPKTLLST